MRSRASRAREALLPWGGLIGGTLGAGLAHQIGSESVFNDCQAASPVPVLIVGVLGLLLIAGGALGSWKVWGHKDEEPSRRLIASVSLMTAGLLAFATLLPMIAALIIPSCLA